MDVATDSQSPEGAPESRLWAAGAGRVHDARTTRPDRKLPPVIVAGDDPAFNVGFELLAGCTRLGNLLGLLDRQEIAEVARHLMWVGREI